MTLTIDPLSMLEESSAEFSEASWDPALRDPVAAAGDVEEFAVIEDEDDDFLVSLGGHSYVTDAAAPILSLSSKRQTLPYFFQSSWFFSIHCSLLILHISVVG